MDKLNKTPLELRNDLISALKENMPIIEDLLTRIREDNIDEDGIYRYYHGSYKVYRLQDATMEIVSTLQALIPERKLTAYFMTIIRDGTGKTFESKSNQHWMQETRPIVEAFLHAEYFLKMAVKYGKGLDLVVNTNPETVEERLCAGLIPSGFAALLSLYEM